MARSTSQQVKRPRTAVVPPLAHHTHHPHPHPHLKMDITYPTLRRRPSMFNLGSKLHVQVEAAAASPGAYRGSRPSGSGLGGSGGSMYTRSLGRSRGSRALKEIVNREDYWTKDWAPVPDVPPLPNRSRGRQPSSAHREFDTSSQSKSPQTSSHSRLPRFSSEQERRLEDPEMYDLSQIGPDTPDFSQFDTTASTISLDETKCQTPLRTRRHDPEVQVTPTVLEAFLQAPPRPRRRAATREATLGRHPSKHRSPRPSTYTSKRAHASQAATDSPADSSDSDNSAWRTPFATRLVDVTLTTPKSTATSLYPSSAASSPTTSHLSLPDVDSWEDSQPGLGIKFDHDQTGSSVSLLAPSTVGLGFSPLSSSASLPTSLEAQATDLTERRVIGDAKRAHIEAKTASVRVYKSAVSHAGPEKTLPSTARDKRDETRAALLAQNTFYLPPIHPRPVLRPSKSARLGVDKKVKEGRVTATSATTAKRPRPWMAGMSTTSPTSSPALSTGTLAKGRAHHRPFLYCSPANAIEPLAPIGSQGGEFPTPSERANSLHRLFGLKHLARSVSKAFDREHHYPSSRQVPLQGTSLEPEANGYPNTSTTTTTTSSSKSRSRDTTNCQNRVWRERVLSEAVSHSMTVTAARTREARQTRPRIPQEFLAVGHVGPVADVGLVADPTCVALNGRGPQVGSA